MEKPKCRICKKRHYGLCDEMAESSDPLDKDEKAASVQKPSGRAGRALVRTVDDPKKGPKARKTDKWREENPERYREYMRGYMQKYRNKRSGND